MYGFKLNFSTLRNVLPESGVISKPIISDMLFQCRDRIPGLHITLITGMCSYEDQKRHLEMRSFITLTNALGSLLYRGCKIDAARATITMRSGLGSLYLFFLCFPVQLRLGDPPPIPTQMGMRKAVQGKKVYKVP